MPDQKDYSPIDTNIPTWTSHQVGFYSALSTAIITLITFAFAMTAIPISGANCPGGGIEYPYLCLSAQEDLHPGIPPVHPGSGCDRARL
jgi:hypothetical protein